MIDLILFCLATIGLTLILVDSKIAEPLRKYVIDRSKNNKFFNFVSQILECYQCTGFWSGLITATIIFTPDFLGGFLIKIPKMEFDLFQIFLLLFSFIFYLLFLLCCGFAGSFLGMWGAGQLGYLESLTNIDLDDLKNE